MKVWEITLKAHFLKSICISDLSQVLLSEKLEGFRGIVRLFVAQVSYFS